MFAVADGGGTSIPLLRMLIPSRSSAHTVHRKQKEEELFVLKWEKDFQNKEEKVARPIVFQKYTANSRRFRFISETVSASENYEVATLPFLKNKTP